MLMHNMLMFKMLSFRLYLIINKKDIQVVHELLDSPSYTPILLYKSGVYNTGKCLHDAKLLNLKTVGS